MRRPTSLNTSTPSRLGTKNTLFNGSLVLNATGFYYMYQGYQISSIVRKSSVQQNIDADIYGAELESIWRPSTT